MAPQSQADIEQTTAPITRIQPKREQTTSSAVVPAKRLKGSHFSNKKPARRYTGPITRSRSKRKRPDDGEDAGVSPIKTPKRKKTSHTSYPDLPSSTSRFFDLPREIRDQIYHELWTTSAPLPLSHKSFHYHIQYTPSPTPLLDPEHPHPRIATFTAPAPPFRAPWLLTNKQLLAESLEQLQRKGDWAPWAKLPTKLTNPTLHKTIPLSPKNAKLLTLEHSYRSPTAHLRELAADIGAGDRPKHLRVSNFSVVMTLFEELREERPIDFSALEMLTGFETVEIETGLLFSTEDVEAEEVKRVFREEVERVAVVMVGGVGEVNEVVRLDEEDRLVWTVRATRVG
ncbi:hypothetical protein BU26DRAFT_559958 [Trematosphaeria pertusa]|uniref:Uncharacterized protein n=1 Tax=Trematosphaeria pertusa TaxID=390896 RepID=A0A6A6IYG2_9PLEO|nr:uncharacterized protein BU26DRAFT_559958 [Trematosphaeria pertusa]KAF2255348.1 hypothetical protein BU26DRAFT_559958 [Trematosphaeria pertusa]